MFTKRSGVDICHNGSYAYIIRSDKKEYTKIGNVTTYNQIDEYRLSTACQGGDHYLAIGSNYYIIKGKEYRKVSNMNLDLDPVVYTLHPNCQNGDFYLATKPGIFKSCTFYIIFRDRGVYRKVTNLTNDAGGVEYKLHDGCKDGLLYWGNSGRCCFMKKSAKWGYEYFETDNLNLNTKSKRYAIHPEVSKLLLNFCRSDSCENAEVIKEVHEVNLCSIPENKTCPAVETDDHKVDGKNLPRMYSTET